MGVQIIEVHAGLAKIRDNDGRLRLVTVAEAERLASAVPRADTAPEAVPRLAQTSTVDYNPQPLVCPGEAAKLLHVTTKTISRWCDTGRLSATRTLGRHRRITLASVQALANRRG